MTSMFRRGAVPTQNGRTLLISVGPTVTVRFGAFFIAAL